MAKKITGIFYRQNREKDAINLLRVIVNFPDAFKLIVFNEEELTTSCYS